jgi:hypothetical protein
MHCHVREQTGDLNIISERSYLLLALTYYEGETANMWQIYIKYKTCDIRNRIFFLEISSANIDTLVLSLFQYAESRSIEAFCLLSRALPHLHLGFFS